VFVEVVRAGNGRVVDIIGKYKVVSITHDPPSETLGTKVWGGGIDVNDPDALRCFLPGAEVGLIAVPAESSQQTRACPSGLAAAAYRSRPR
jgi:hypothetical protein